MTSIEWLIEQIKSEHNLKALSAAQWIKIFEQAKEMHRIEHGKTWENAIDTYIRRGDNYIKAWEDFVEYYSETFKKD